MCDGGTVRESGGCCCCPVRWGRQVFADEELVIRDEAVMAVPIIGDERLAFEADFVEELLASTRCMLPSDTLDNGWAAASHAGPGDRPSERRSHLYEQPSTQTAAAFLKKWYFWVTHSRLEPMIEAAHGQAPLARYLALVRQQDCQRADRGHQQPRPGRKGQSPRLSLDTKPQSHGLSPRRQARPQTPGLVHAKPRGTKYSMAPSGRAKSPVL